MLRRPSFVLSALSALILFSSSAATRNQEHESPLRFRVTPAPGESDDGIRPAVRPRLDWSTEAIDP